MSPRHRGIDEPLPRKVIRCAAFAGACVLQLIFISVFVASWRIRSPPAPAAAVAMTQIVVPSATSNPAPQPSPAPIATAALAPVPMTLTPAAPLLQVPSPGPSLPARTAPSTDWAQAARLAAVGAARAELLEQRRRQASGERTAPDNAQSAEQPSFPWSRQPLTSWFDFDPKTLAASIRLGRHCEFVLVLILPVIGCVLGHVDPDPGRGDLFDPKFRPAPLQLPTPALPAPSAP
jgi:hypothetical protein